jgi:hypothetical protein
MSQRLTGLARAATPGLLLTCATMIFLSQIRVPNNGAELRQRESAGVRLRATLTGHRAGVPYLLFSPDG